MSFLDNNGVTYLWQKIRDTFGGTVTEVKTGGGLTGGPITESGTISHSNSVTAGTAGTSSATSGTSISIPYVTYDSNGHVTASGTHTHSISKANITALGIPGSDTNTTYTFDRKTVTMTQNLAANGAAETTVTATNSGYTPLAIATWNCTGTGVTQLNVYGVWLSDPNTGTCKVHLKARNGSSSSSTFTYTITVLWVKSN